MNKIEVFGTGCLMGCSTCKIETGLVTKALSDLGLTARVVQVDDIGDAQTRGIKHLPALAIDGVVKAEGRALTIEEIKVILQQA